MASVAVFRWTNQTVDNRAGGWTSLALGDGKPCLSFVSEKDEVKFAKWEGFWKVEIVDRGPLVRCTSLALDSRGFPHLSYSMGNKLKYACWNGSSWEIQTVESGKEGSLYGVGLYSSLILDNRDLPRIFYYDSENRALKYAKIEENRWVIETVVSSGVGRYSISAALDRAGNPHACFYAEEEGDLCYARWKGGSWMVERVDTDGNVGMFCHLILDSKDNPHISYYDVDNGNLKYAHWNGSSWEIQTVDSDGDVGMWTSIALDAKDYPHISYYDSGRRSLKYARWNGHSWEIWTVDSGGDVGSFTSIALDSTGVPHIGYYDQLKHEVKIAKLVVSRESKIGGWMIIALVLFLVLLAMVHLRRK